MQNIVGVAKFGKSMLSEECVAMDTSSDIQLTCGDDGQYVSFCVHFEDGITSCTSATFSVTRMGEYISTLGVGCINFYAFMCFKLQWIYWQIPVKQQHENGGLPSDISTRCPIKGQNIRTDQSDFSIDKI
jgi:hypothetical protein